MKPKVLLISWNKGYAQKQASRFECEGWDAMLERENAGRACKLAGELKPNVIVVYLAYQPKQGIEAARAIRKRKSTGNIPFVFVYQ